MAFPLWAQAVGRAGPPARAAGLRVPLELVVQVWVAVQAPRWRLRVRLVLTAAAHAPQEEVVVAL